jgi:hypothetical protein
MACLPCLSDYRQTKFTIIVEGRDRLVVLGVDNLSLPATGPSPNSAQCYLNGHPPLLRSGYWSAPGL